MVGGFYFYTMKDDFKTLRIEKPMRDFLKGLAEEKNLRYRGRLSEGAAIRQLIEDRMNISKEVDEKLYATAMEFLARGIQAGFDLDSLRSAVVMALDEIHSEMTSDGFESYGESTPKGSEHYRALREEGRSEPTGKVITKSDIAAAADVLNLEPGEVYRFVATDLVEKLAAANAASDLAAARDIAGRLAELDPELVTSLLTKATTGDDSRQRAVAMLESSDHPLARTWREQRDGQSPVQKSADEALSDKVSQLVYLIKSQNPSLRDLPDSEIVRKYIEFTDD